MRKIIEPMHVNHPVHESRRNRCLQSASINLAALVKNAMTTHSVLDFEELDNLAYKLTVNLNKIIDNNFYAVSEARTSKMLHRPIGIGVQELADALVMMRMAFESPDAH